MVPTLERLGYGVVGRTDPLQALRIFNERPGDFDLVITDFMMPHLTGEKLAEEIRRRRPDMPIILTTGFSETLSEERLRSLGLQGLLAKPYTIREIDALIRSALAARS
jgi:CheY-like chemotaxis protein